MNGEEKNKILQTKRGYFTVDAKTVLNKSHELATIFSSLGFIPTHINDCYECGELKVKYYGLSDKFDSIKDEIEPLEYVVRILGGNVNVERSNGGDKSDIIKR